MTASLLYALAAAGANLAGGLVITTASPRGRTTQRLLIAFGAGFMIALVFLAMIPHAVERGVSGAVAVLVGYLLVHLTQHVIPTHFHFGEETHHEEMVDRWVGVTALLGLLLHTFFDGVAIASGFHVDVALGFVVFLGILLHKVPEGVTVASIMMASGNGRRAALVGVLLLGASTVLGVLVTHAAEPLRDHGLALSAGVTIYVAASNLVPEVQKKGRSWTMTAALLLGVLFYALAWSVLRDVVH